MPDTLPLLEAATPRVVFVGSGTRGPFSLQDGGSPIRVQTASSLVVRRYSSVTDEDGTLLVLNTDYTVTNTDPDNASVTLTAGQAVLTSSQRLVVERTQTVSGVVSYTTGGNFAGTTLGEGIDRLAERVQELRRDVDRAVKVDWRETEQRALPIKPSTRSALTRETDGSIGQAAIGDIETVAAAVTDIEALADIAADITAVANIDAEIVIVADAIADVETVADNITDVQTVAQELYYFVRPEQRLARGDGVKGYSGVATSGDQTFTDSVASWTSADIGKVIVIKAAGAAVYKANSATISAGGSSYVVGDLLTVSGGTSRTPTVFRVDAVSGGAVTAVSVRCRGYYSALPSNPVSTTGGSGTGCTLTLTTETGYGAHRTTIASINSATSIELTAAPTTSVASNARYTYGTDDTTALQATLNALGFMGAMALRAGKVYCFSNLTLPTNLASGVVYNNRNAIVCPDGLAELACIGGGDDDYAIAPDRWLSGSSSKSFSGSPWELRNLFIDGLGQVERSLVHKSFNSVYQNLYLRGGLIADFEATRQNQDGTDGAAGYNAGNKITDIFFDGGALYQFRNLGDTTGIVDATTDGDMKGCEFNGNSEADYGPYFGNTGGWMVDGCRWYGHRIAGCYTYQVGRGGSFTDNNSDGGTESLDTVPGMIIGEMGSYADAVIGPGNKHYARVIVDFKADTSAETIRIKGDHFQTKVDSSPDAQAIHNNNRAQKLLILENCTGDDAALYARASGNTNGIIELIDCTRASASGTLKRVTLRDDPGATGINEVYYKDTASPAAADDIRYVEYYSRDSGGNETLFASERVEIGDPTNGAEFGRRFWSTVANGTFADRFGLQGGLFAASLADPGNGNFNALTYYQVNSLQVIGTRKTGWSTATGTATRTTFDTTTVTTQQLAERVKALIDDLHATAGHGLIGT